LLIGATPPNAMRDWRYPALTFVAGALTSVFYRSTHEFAGQLMIVLDAAGLSLFAVAGVEKALMYGIQPFIAALMGTITAVGGGVIRDVLLARIPVVLQADVYATAAFAGAVAVLPARRAGMTPSAAAIVGGTICFALRVTAVSRGWQLPKAIGF
jgi:uncharacterized membrane protein YeiH